MHKSLVIICLQSVFPFPAPANRLAGKTIDYRQSFTTLTYPDRPRGTEIQERT